MKLEICIQGHSQVYDEDVREDASSRSFYTRNSPEDAPSGCKCRLVVVSLYRIRFYGVLSIFDFWGDGGYCLPVPPPPPARPEYSMLGYVTFSVPTVA